MSPHFLQRQRKEMYNFHQTCVQSSAEKRMLHFKAPLPESDNELKKCCSKRLFCLSSVIKLEFRGSVGFRGSLMEDKPLLFYRVY